MEVDCSDGETFVAGPSSSSSSSQQQQQQRRQPVASGSRAASNDDDAVVYDDSEWDEVVEESLIHVTLDNADDTSNVNATSNVRVIAIDTDSPALQVENKVGESMISPGDFLKTGVFLQAFAASNVCGLRVRGTLSVGLGIGCRRLWWRDGPIVFSI